MSNSRPSPQKKVSEAKETEVFWRSGPRRTTFVSLLCGGFGAAWILLHSPRAAQVLAPEITTAGESTRISTVISNSMRDSRPGRNRWDRQDGGQPRQPLYLANLACQTGDYIVSVQRVNSDRYTFSNNSPYGVRFPGSEPVRLRLQVMSMRSGRMQRIDRFKTELSVVDNTGYRLNVLEDAREFQFPDGIGCMFQLSPPANDAATLGSIDGAIQLLPDTRTGVNVTPAAKGSSPATTAPSLQPSQTLPFHIENVPLPWRMRVYGMVGAAVLDAQTARYVHLPPGNTGTNTPMTLQDAWMEQVLKTMPREAFQTPLRPAQPNTLVLAENASNVAHLFVPAPPMSAETAVWRKRTLPLTCKILPHVQPNGRIEARIRMAGPNANMVEARTSCWDNAPVMLAIPAVRLFPQEAKDAMLVLYLNLHLDNPPPEQMFSGALPKTWRAQKGASGGALSGEIVTEKGPFGIGTATLNVRRWDQAGIEDKKQRHLVVALDTRGKFNLPNLAAGRYQLELGEVHPYQSAALARCSCEEFLQQRLGIRQAWLNIVTQKADIKAGDRVELPPWVFTGAK